MDYYFFQRFQFIFDQKLSLICNYSAWTWSFFSVTRSREYLREWDHWASTRSSWLSSWPHGKSLDFCSQSTAFSELKAAGGLILWQDQGRSGAWTYHYSHNKIGVAIVVISTFDPWVGTPPEYILVCTYSQASSCLCGHFKEQSLTYSSLQPWKCGFADPSGASNPK